MVVRFITFQKDRMKRSFPRRRKTRRSPASALTDFTISWLDRRQLLGQPSSATASFQLVFVLSVFSLLPSSWSVPSSLRRVFSSRDARERLGVLDVLLRYDLGSVPMHPGLSNFGQWPAATTAKMALLAMCYL
jgi:hypothetical protein